MNKKIRKELRTRGLDVSNHTHNPKKAYYQKTVFTDSGFTTMSLEADRLSDIQRGRI